MLAKISSLFLVFIAVALYLSHQETQKAAAATLSHFSVVTYGATGDGVTNDASAFQQAVNAAAVSGGIVDVPAPATSYKITSPVTLKSNVQLVGAGSSTTKITGGVGSGYVFTGGSKTIPISDIVISGIAIDLNYLASAGGVSLEYIEGLTISDFQVNNVNQWGIWIGVLDGTDSVVRNNNIVINNCSFSGLNSTYEQILIFNSSNVTIKNSRFSNVTNVAGSAIGLYQIIDTVTIDSNIFNLPSGRGSYYSKSVDNVTYSNNIFNGQGGSSISGIIGANLSDNGAFGQTVVYNYNFNNNTFKNLTSGLQVGALYGGRVTRNTFSENVNALLINDGNGPAGNYYSAKFISVDNNTFTNNNSTNNFHILHPGIAFTTNGKLTAGASHVYIQNNQFEDDQTTKTQRYAIALDGGVIDGTAVNTQWDYLTFLDNDLTADTANGGVSIAFADGANFGSHTLIYQNTNYSGTPTQDSTNSGVSGTITTKASPYIGNIHITSADYTDVALASSTTNSKGQFSFSIHPGNYILFTDSNGQSTQEATFTVVKDQVTTLTIAPGPTQTPTPTPIPKPTQTEMTTIKQKQSDADMKEQGGPLDFTDSPFFKSVNKALINKTPNIELVIGLLALLAPILVGVFLFLL